MIVEAIRLLCTLAFTALGLQIGRALHGRFPAFIPDAASKELMGVVLGVAAGFAVGGVLGRAIRRGLVVAPDRLAPRLTGPELFAGSFGLILGLAIGVVVASPVLFFLPPVLGWPFAGVLVLVAAAFGARVCAVRANDLLAAVGLRPRGAMARRRLNGAGVRVFLIDSSAAIDGRVLELARSGLVRGDIEVPAFVIDELQGIADSGDRNRRRRGRRGLDVLEALRDVPGVELTVIEDTVPEHPEVDAKLVALADRAEATLITTDHNLAKAAGLRGIPALNPHSLGEALKQPLEVGTQTRVQVAKNGTEPGQGVGYLEDGTMVVVEGAADRIGQEVAVEITSSVRTAVGRMVFCRLVE